MRPAIPALLLALLPAVAVIAAEPVPDPAAWLAETRARASRLPPPLAAAVAPGLDRADAVHRVLLAAFAPSAGWTRGHALGGNLADYAGNEGLVPAEFEGFIAAARRILAGEPPTRHAPAATGRWLEAAATQLHTAARSAESAAGAPRSPELAALAADLRLTAQLARFHARRAAAAVHYNLFKRGLKLAELVAATYAEKDALAAWRDLVALAEAPLPPGAPPRDPRLLAHWRAELRRVEASYKDLEEQCCPPDEAVMREKVWSPATDGDRTPPYIRVPARGPAS